MKILKPLSLIVIVAFAYSPALAQSDAVKTMNAYYAKDDALTLKMDFAGLKKLKGEYSTKDYVSYGQPDKNGKAKKSTRAEEFKSLDGIAAFIDSVKSGQSHIEHLTLGKTTAVAIVSSRGELKTKKLPSDGKAHMMGSISVSQDTWIKVGRSWKMKTSKTLSSHVTLDGRPLPTR